jgi:hypothetical protein
MPAVFISYRRDDTAATARHLADTLDSAFGRKRVFLDVSAIRPGVDVREAIRSAVARAKCMVVLIGPRWSEADAAGKRKIDDPDDYVRAEIVTALDSQRRVLPILVDGAMMPKEKELPREVVPLASRNALELRHVQWERDVARLIGELYGGGILGRIIWWHKKSKFNRVLSMAAIMVVLLPLLFMALQPLSVSGSQFVQLLGNAEFKTAYLLLAESLRERGTEQEFQSHIHGIGLDRAASVFWHSREIKNSSGELLGTVTLRDGTKLPLALLLRYEQGMWRVAGFDTTEGAHYFSRDRGP